MLTKTVFLYNISKILKHFFKAALRRVINPEYPLP